MRIFVCYDFINLRTTMREERGKNNRNVVVCLALFLVIKGGKYVKNKMETGRGIKKLIKEKSLHKITIQDIVEESGLTRQSFYYHFHDICEIIEWICKNTLLEKCDVEEKTAGLLDLYTF